MSEEYERVPISDWRAVEDHLREFVREGGEVAESAERIEVRVGNASFSVTRDGIVTAGMALHDFEDGGVEALYFDHERERIRIESGDSSYVFRRP